MILFRLWRTLRISSSYSSSHSTIITNGRRSRASYSSTFSHLESVCSFSAYTQNKMDGLKTKNSNFASTTSSDFSGNGRLSESSQSNFTVIVEGNIGSGKSTLLQHFDRPPLIQTFAEPIEKWTNVEGHNALGLLYEDPRRWSFSFNMYALLTRVQMHMKPYDMQPVKMLERSLYSTYYCFVQNAILTGKINSYENALLSQWFKYLVAGKKANVDLIVYVRADPDVCYERLKARSRKEEAGVPMCLIESLHELHDDWLLRKKFPLPAPVLVLDANSDLKTMTEIYDSRRQEILCGFS